MIDEKFLIFAATVLNKIELYQRQSFIQVFEINLILNRLSVNVIFHLII
jgi:hypothetical protein